MLRSSQYLQSALFNANYVVSLFLPRERERASEDKADLPECLSLGTAWAPPAWCLPSAASGNECLRLCVSGVTPHNGFCN